MRNPITDPQVGDRWRNRSDSKYILRIDSITRYINCKTPNNGDHVFDFDWFERHMLEHYDFLGGPTIQERISVILKKQEELTDLIKGLADAN